MKAAVLFPLLLVCHAAAAQTISSGPQQVALLELYTSEGCSSCPPADRWLSSLEQTQPALPVIPLAFHVDYWDSLGWKDRFAQPRFTERQHSANQRIGSSFVYTPQLMLNGRDWRHASTKTLQAELAQTAAAPVKIMLQRDGLRVSASAISLRPLPDSDLVVVTYRNGESSSVKAGENAGATLHHDYVARNLNSTMLAGGKASLQIPLPPEAAKDSVVAFVQQRQDNLVLNALRLK
jgi:hypothetical protein